MRRTVVLAVATAAVAAFGIGLALRPVTHPRRTPELVQVRAQLASRYYRTLPSKVLSKPTVPGIIDALHDRYTTYLTPSEFRVAKRTSAGDYGGVGGAGVPPPRGLLGGGAGRGGGRGAGGLPGGHNPPADGAGAPPR